VSAGDANDNGDLTGIYAQGGNSTGDTGGHGGNVAITGATISLSNISSVGGNSEAASGGTVISAAASR